MDTAMIMGHEIPIKLFYRTLENPKEYFDFGDDILIKFKNGMDIIMTVSGFNQYDRIDESKNQTIFLMSKYVYLKGCMFTPIQTQYEWEASHIRKYILPQIYALLPREIKELIIPVKTLVRDHLCDKGVSDYIFIPSISDVTKIQLLIMYQMKNCLQNNRSKVFVLIGLEKKILKQMN